VEGRVARYARVAPDGVAGWIEVECRPAQGGTDVRVTYRLTATEPSAVAVVRDFAAGFDAHIGGWRAAIEGAIEAGRIEPGDA
jgi:hypothetical protein